MQIYTGVYRSVREGRSKNQDSLSVQHVRLARGECLLAVVCDGIGSLDEAQEAGCIVVSKLTDWFYQIGKELIYKKASKETILVSLQNQILQIQEFLRYFQQKEQLQTGTTCSALLIIRKRYYTVHIGDSRIYSFQKRSFWQKQTLRLRTLTKDDTDTKGRLCRALGMAGTDRAVFQTGTLRRRMGFLVCSDGFYKKNDMNQAAQMLAALSERKRQYADVSVKSQLDRRLEQLGRMAYERGNTDDKAAVVVLIK